MEPNARDKLIKARAALVLDQPFFATIALRLELVEDKTAPTAYTDGQIIGYNPAFIDSITLEETKGLLCHEVLHIAAAHHIRRDARTPRRWNQAADYAINPLIEPLMALPKGGLLDPAYKDLGAEAIYSRLPEESDGDGENGDAGADPGQCGEVRDLKNGTGPGQTLTPQEIERAQADIKVLVSQAAQAARIMGQMPAGLERFTDGIIKPKLNPYETLRRFITETARDGVTWSRPNRRYMTQGLYMPARRSLELKPLAVVVDTSASIGPDELSQFESEINAILEEYKTDILLIYCDTSAARIEEIKSEDLPIKIKAVGGGGTDFRPAFTEIEKRNYTPSVLIYLTDLCGEFPDKEPDYPVLWAKIGDDPIKPPFGEVIQI